MRLDNGTDVNIQFLHEYAANTSIIIRLLRNFVRTQNKKNTNQLKNVLNTKETAEQGRCGTYEKRKKH